MIDNKHIVCNGGVWFCSGRELPGKQQGESSNNRSIMNIWRVQMQKPLNAIWNFLLKWSFLSSLYI